MDAAYIVDATEVSDDKVSGGNGNIAVDGDVFDLEFD